MSKRKKQTRSSSVFSKICVVITALFLIGSLFCIGTAAYIELNFSRKVDAELFTVGSIPQSPSFFAYRFTDRTNREGRAEALSDSFYAQKKNAYLRLEEIPQAMIDAFVAIEDKKFFSHTGVDWRRTLAAGVNYLLGFSDTFGASTITQQLVKNMTGKSEVRVGRKLQEILYAKDLERMLDKSEIMELYLNVIHFSDNCNGVGAAAEHYFSKAVGELSIAECATIAAITNNPSYYNPIRNPENNLARRNLILREMYEDGKLSEKEYHSAKETPLTLCVDSVSNHEGINSWYADMVIEDVITDLMETYHLSRSAASHAFYTKGLRIDVAMDEEIQRIVEEYYRSAILPLQSDGAESESAMIVIDQRTGDILAVAGAIGEKEGNHLQNFATQTKRPPGSTIKPISVYAPALEEGLITWGTVFDDVPTDFHYGGHLVWPQNATRVYRGLTDTAYAVAHSTNTVAVRTLRLLDRETAFRYAKEKFHLESLLTGEKNDFGDAALALGQLQNGVTLRELTAAYTVFADGGTYHPYRSYYRVLDTDGNVLLSKADHSEVVLSKENAAVMTKLLQGVVKDGTSGKITLQSLTECAGKTGTSGNDYDRWFVGYTPEFLCGVWCGYPYPQPLNERHLCTSIWNSVMRRIVSVRKGVKHFSVPSGVVRMDYCKDSGLLPCEVCSRDPRGNRIQSGWFVVGTEPKEQCKTHVLCDYDMENGGVIHGDGIGEKVALIHVERHFPIPLFVTDAQYVWRGDPAEYPINEQRRQAYFEKNLLDYCGSSNVESQYNRSAPIPKSPEASDLENLIPIPWWEERREFT